jgi:eukaryotic-like serine/threonine-protein kinase
MSVLANRFRLEAHIGEGALATVWRARDLVTGERVAIKRLKEAATSPSMRRRLRREARAVEQLDHPHVVRAICLDDDAQGRPFLALELVAGEALSVALHGQRPLGYLVPVVDQILSALAYAHARGVVHRDLTPNNVVVTRGAAGRPHIKLLDFGFARVQGEPETDDSKATFGSPGYMSPEQAAGATAVGPSTDLYALAAIAWEVFTGAVPFDGRNATEVLMRHLSDPLPPFKPRAGLACPPGIAGWLARGLAKDPADRFASAGSMRRAFARLFDHTMSETLTGIQRTVDDGPPSSADVVSTSSFSHASVVGVIDATRMPLVGRSGTREWLWNAVIEVSHRHKARCLVMEGDAGVGTSRLGDWLLEMVAEQGWMQTGRGHWLRGHVRSGLAEALIGLWDLKPDPDALRRAFGHELASRDLVALARWLDRPSRRPPQGAILRALALTARRQPVLLFLDGFDRAHALEREAVAQLVDGLRRAKVPMLLLLCAQTPSPGMGEVEGPVDELLRGREDGTSLRRIRRLSRPEVVELLQQRMVIHPDAAGAIAKAARGVALYAVLAVELLIAEGALQAEDGLYIGQRDPLPLPRTLGELARAWLLAGFNQQGHGALLRDLAERLAVVGEAFGFELVEEVGAAFGLDAMTLETGIDGLVRLGVLKDVAEDAFAFRHPVLRRALLDGVLGRTDATMIHRRIAEAKSRWRPDAGEALAVEIAAHYRAAADLHRAVEALLLAANRAERSWRLARASTLFARAERWLDQLAGMTSLDPLRLAARAGRATASLAAGEWGRAARLAQRLGESAKQQGDVDYQAEAARIIATVYLREGRLADAARVIVATVQPDQKTIRAGLELVRARLEARRGALESAWTLARAASGRFRAAAEGRGEAEANLMLGELSLRLGDQAKSLEGFAQAVKLAGAAGDDRLGGRAGIRLGDLLRASGDLPGALQALDRALVSFERVGDLAGVARTRRAQGDVNRGLGQGVRASAAYRAAAGDFQTIGDRFQLGVCLTQLGRLAIQRGVLEEADAALTEAAAAFQSVEDPLRQAFITAYLAQVSHRRRMFRARDAHLQQVLRADATQPLVSADFAEILEEIARSLPRVDPRRAALRARARAAWLRVGATDRADALAE